MAPRFFTLLTGRNLPKIRQQREPEPSIINENTVADFTRVVEQTGILQPALTSPRPDDAKPLTGGLEEAQRRDGGWRGNASALVVESVGPRRPEAPCVCGAGPRP
jgi:hypothetical protein